MAFREADVVPSAHEVFAAELRGVLEEQGASSRSVALRGMSFMEWALLVPEARGPLNFDRFAFQRELYDDACASDREVVLSKGTQVGVSAWAIRFALFHADVHQRIALYTFPSERELNDFSRQRVGPVIRASEHLRSRIPADAVNNVGQKQVGAGWLVSRGTNKPIDSIDADVIVFDEYDTSVQANIEASERRVTGPNSAGLLRRVGVPTIPGFGIAKAYDASDQRVWTIRCECGTWNPLRGVDAFEHNVDQDAVALVCRACRKPIDVRAGEWVATYPDRDVRGYHLPKLLIPGKRVLAGVIERSRRTRPDQIQLFHNLDLGEAWAPTEGRLSLEQVRACVREDLAPLRELRSSNVVTAGIDVASRRALNVVIEESVDEYTGKRVFVGEIDDRDGRSAMDHLCDLMLKFNVDMACIDHAPEGRFAMEFAARFPGRVYRIGYFTQKAGRTNPPPWHIDDQDRYIGLQRTMAIDATLERFRLQRVLLPPLDTLPTDYASHLGAVVRRVEEAAAGTIKIGYDRTGPDDYLHAEAYNLAAIEVYWRNRGLQAIHGAGPVPLALIDAAADVSEDQDSDLWLPAEPTYRTPFD